MHSARRFALALGLALATTQSVWGASLEGIQERHYLIVAVKDNFFPLGYRSSTGELAGFEIDLARQLARALFSDPTAVRFVPVRNQDRQSALEAGQADLVIAGWSITVPRARATDFSLPYLTFGQSVLLGQSSPVQRLADLGGRKIAVLGRSTGEQALGGFVPEATLVPVASYQEGIDRLTSGQIEGFAADRTVLAGWMRGRSGYRLLDTQLDTSGLAIGMPRGLQADALRRWVNAQVAQLLKSGWLAERASAWGLSSEP